MRQGIHQFNGRRNIHACPGSESFPCQLADTCLKAHVPNRPNSPGLRSNPRNGGCVLNRGNTPRSPNTSPAGASALGNPASLNTVEACAGVHVDRPRTRECVVRSRNRGTNCRRSRRALEQGAALNGLATVRVCHRRATRWHLPNGVYATPRASAQRPYGFGRHERVHWRAACAGHDRAARKWRSIRRWSRGASTGSSQERQAGLSTRA